MINDVRVYDSKGVLKRTITSQELQVQADARYAGYASKGGKAKAGKRKKRTSFPDITGYDFDDLEI